MKDIKMFIIGFLTCACMFLIMGQTKQEADANMDANMEQVMKMANKMKDIKSYVIGFLTCACMFLIMGQMPAMGDEQIEQMKNMANQMKNAGLMPERVGKYQIAPNSQTRDIYLLDTVSGETYISKSSKGEWEKHISGL